MKHYTEIISYELAMKLKEKGFHQPLYTQGDFQSGEKWQFVTSHTARRSFVTNLYKQGVDIYTISKLCGHSSVEMTKQYICCGPIIKDSVKDYLNSFSK